MIEEERIKTKMTKINVPDMEERTKVIEDLDHSYIVEAGAGTGKTSLLLERVRNLIKKKRVPLSEMVIITFTEKAAAELKMRLRNQLEREYKESKEQESEILAQALADYERSHIGTIHSFAAGMLRERPVEAGIDPQFEVADEMTLSLLFDEVWKKWLDREMGVSPSALKKPLKFGVRISTIKEVAREMLNHRDLYEGRPARMQTSLSSFLESFEGHLKELLDLKKHCVNKEDEGYQLIDTLYRIFREIKRKNRNGREQALLDMRIARRRGNRKNWNPEEMGLKVKAIFDQIEKEINDVQQKISQDICAELAEWIGGFLKEFDLERKRRSYLDFEDLLICARDMLRDNKEIRRYFQKKFSFIFVDEFQDTDPLQTEIIFFLSEEHPEADRWNKVKVKKGKLFLVADPKQSIYRFRRADIETYYEAKKLLLERGRSSHMVENFRSVPSLIQWVNLLFADLLRKEKGYDFQVEYIPIKAQRDEIQTSDSVIIVTAPRDILETKKNRDDLRELESQYMAAFIKEIVDHKRWKVQDKKCHLMREARFSDFAILFRKTTGIEHYEESFRKAHIPYRMVGSKYFFKRQELMSLLSMMKAIDNPSDECSIVAALRSEFLGHSDEEIFLFRESGGQFNYLRNKKQNEKISVSLELLRRFHLERNDKKLSSLLMDLFCETKILEFFYLKPLGEQRVANLLKVVDMARSHEKRKISHFKSFIKWLEDMYVEEREAEESPISEEDDDAVRMMTIHKAKGLEFPFVILAMLESGHRRRNSFIIDRKEGRFEFSLGPLKPATFHQWLPLEEKKEEAEEKRILYVATTRAREKLILPIFPKGKEEGLMTFLKGRMPENKESLRGKKEKGIYFFDEGWLSLKTETPPPFRKGFHEEYLQKDCSKIIEKRKNWLNDLSLIKKKAKEGMILKSATSIKEEMFLEAESGVIRKRDHGMEVGRMVHDILSRMDLSRPEEADQWIALMVDSSFITDVSKEVSFLIKKAIEMRTVKEASRNFHLREVPFSIGAGPIILEGSIDLLYEKDGSFIAVDYKTDRVIGESEIETLMTHYHIQASVYAYALSKILNNDVKEIRFLFLNNQKEKMIRIDDPIIEYGRSLVEGREPLFHLET